MGELELVGLHEDGEHLVLVGSDGQRFRLRIDEPLRAAVRRDRPQLEQLRAERYGSLAPREIQARIRAGQSAAAVAESADIAIEQVRRYEGPVLAEREHVAGLAQRTRVGRDSDAPVLGDLVPDRLAARGVDLATIEWDAFRDGPAPWTVVVRFVAGGEKREALWTFDAQARAVQALEDEARWLSETELADEVIPRRHLAAVRDVVFDVGPDGSVRPLTPLVDDVVLDPEDEPVPMDATAALLDDLRTKRGVRQPFDDSEPDEEFEGFGPQRAFDLGGAELPPAAHPPHSDPSAATDDTVLPAPSGPRRITEPETPVALEPDEPLPDDAAPPLVERPRGRRGRPSVPSWDEIVFGAKPE
ncbi:septation protein SepH [Cellulomonas sp. ATA003]|uniref:septation protein SepH n=1 Tax=Cellulomonas sp. ATA003 TaxID=3073064 RepID=UPI002872C612|nr:septation protein SepH [Cellulomonas sp. ATA003]WNB84441.1 septation protein SepH [Cellulomonas sp. ATA003]